MNINKFWDNKIITPTGCWEWQGTIQANGYGKYHTRIHGVKKKYYVHRLAWELINGTIPLGNQVCHTCDNPLCFNPQHLFTGTNQDNVDDKVLKGRQPKGSKKFTPEQILAILEDSRRQVDIARDYNTSQSHISRIKSRKASSFPSPSSKNVILSHHDYPSPEAYPSQRASESQGCLSG